jgi:hypothetical protein
MPATIVAHSVTSDEIPARQSGSVTVSCQAGEQMISGGYSLNVFESGNASASYPSSTNSWTVTAISAPSFVVITATVYCLQADYSLATTIVQSTAGTASCPAGSALLSGGYQGEAPNNGGFIGAVNYSKPVANGWQSDSPIVYALCATQNAVAAPAVMASFTLPIAWGAGNGGTAICPSGQFATGGGFALISGKTAGVISNKGTPISWSIWANGTSYGSATMQAWAACVTLPTPPPVTPTPSPTVTSTPITPTSTVTPTPTPQPPLP